jgi:hypothetical protein
VETNFWYLVSFSQFNMMIRFSYIFIFCNFFFKIDIIRLLSKIGPFVHPVRVNVYLDYFLFESVVIKAAFVGSHACTILVDGSWPFCVCTGVWTQGLTLAEQTLYHLRESTTASPVMMSFLTSCFLRVTVQSYILTSNAHTIQLL